LGGREGIKKYVKREKRGPFIEEEGGNPLGGWPAMESLSSSSWSSSLW
jgi:hypothetical protein